jgi:hypothetical protein
MNVTDPVLSLPDFLVGMVHAVFYVVGGVALAQIARRGKRLTLVTTLYWLLLGGAATLLLAAVVCLLGGSASGLWWCLGVAGLIGVIALARNGAWIWRSCRELEERRMAAHDL